MLLRFSILFLLFLLVGCDSDNSSQKITNNSTVTPGSIGVQEMELLDPPEGAVYVDPENTSDENQDGTIEHPFESFGALRLLSDTVYAVKRGTILEIDELILKDGMTIMSYGNGERPVLLSTVAPPEGTNQHAIVSGWGGIADITIRDVVVECPTATSCIRFGGSDLNNSNLNIINVRTKGGSWGIRFFGTQDLFIHNSEVSHTKDDGMFLQANDGVEISNCYVHDVNLNWQPPTTPESEAGGDAIQFDSCNNWHVHHNRLDRTNSGNKFCFISNNAAQNNGIFEFNETAGPLTVGGGASIYFHNGDGLIVRYNIILGPAAYALFSHTTNLQIYGNIVASTDRGFYTGASASVYNNTFYDVGAGLSGGNVEAINNIFVMLENTNPFSDVSNLTESHNLVEGADTPANSFTGTADFADPDNYDFHLTSTSDAIDAGTESGFTTDMEGTSIPQGNAPDIGALEYVQ